MTIFSERFKYLRDQNGWTQQEIAKELGVSRSTIAGYESSEKSRIPREDTLIKIANLFNVSTDYLLGRDLSVFLFGAEEKYSDGLQFISIENFACIVPKETIVRCVDIPDFNLTENTPLLVLMHEKLPLKSSKKNFINNNMRFFATKKIIDNLIFEADSKLPSLPAAHLEVERDIANQLEMIKEELTSNPVLLFYGCDLSKEAKEYLIDALEYTIQQTKKINLNRLNKS